VRRNAVHFNSVQCRPSDIDSDAPRTWCTTTHGIIPPVLVYQPRTTFLSSHHHPFLSQSSYLAIQSSHMSMVNSAASYMENAKTGNFRDSEMQNIKRCRVFLQVECLSDSCTADGLTTDPELQAQSLAVSQSGIKWPLQAKPGPRSWAVWRRFLKRYTRDSTNNRGLVFL
jgi:hypothetical protein